MGARPARPAEPADVRRETPLAWFRLRAWFREQGIDTVTRARRQPDPVGYAGLCAVHSWRNAEYISLVIDLDSRQMVCPDLLQHFHHVMNPLLVRGIR